MNYPKAIGASSTALLLMLLLTKYQNCAPVPTESYFNESDSEVRIVDNWIDKKVAFVEQEIVLHDSGEHTQIDGLCARAQNLEKFAWVLNDGEEPVLKGTTECQGGGFRLSIEQLSQLECGHNYQLKVSDQSGESDSLIIQRKCAPLAAVDVSEPGSVDQCYFELEPNQANAARSCYLTCYRYEKLSRRDLVENSNCPIVQY